MPDVTLREVKHPELGWVVVVRSPFNRDFVEDLKASIPWRSRAWDSRRKAWFVRSAYAVDVLGLIESRYPGARVVWSADLFPDLPGHPPGPCSWDTVGGADDADDDDDDGDDDDGGVYGGRRNAGEGWRARSYRSTHSAPPPPPPPPPSTSAWSVLGLLPSVDPDVARAAYRILATKHHPDRGGSTVGMQEINAAWDTLRGLLDRRQEKR